MAELKVDPQPHQRTFLECNGTEEKDPVRIVFFGGGAGGGKTWSILVDNLLGVHDPDYFSVFFRKTTVELETNLWPEALKMYAPILKDDNGNWIGKSHIAMKDKVITFPSGAKSKFSYLQYDKDADSWYGSELCKVYIDELQMHSEYVFTVLRSRNRSRANVPKGMRFTLNPDSTHWMYEWIQPFLLKDDSGFPDPDLGGRIRYFLIINGDLITSWDKQELIDKYDKAPQTYSYVPATLKDNLVLQEMDKEYFDVLDSLPEQKRNQLLLGSWALDEDAGLLFQRGMFKPTLSVPLGARYVRGWDLAGTAPEQGKAIAKDADYTVGVKMAKCPDGYYYIVGMDRFQDRAGPRDNRIIKVAHEDGVDCHVIMPQDPAAAGKFALEQFQKQAIEAGVICKKDRIPYNKSKLTKATPWAIAVQNGFVYIVESTFTKSELDLFYREHELFDGVTRSTRTVHEDSVDSASTAFNELAAERVIPPFSLGTNTSQSRFSQLSSQAIPDIK